MHVAPAIDQIESRYRSLAPLMDERMRRQWAATEAQTYGSGGVSAVSDVTGMSRNTIRKGIDELEVRKSRPKAAVETRLRREGGRKRLTVTDPGLLEALELLVEPMSRGDPMSPLRWTCKSTARLAKDLTQQAHPIGAWTVGALLRADGYSLQSNRKTKEGATHPHRNAQFEYINAMVKRLQQRGQPVISVDTTTQAGLKIRAELDRGIYPVGVKVTNAELGELNLKLASFMATGTTPSFRGEETLDQLNFTRRLSGDAQLHT